MKNENYIVIQGWMINELKLNGNELLLYSIIYGFSQDGESCFQGSSNYIAETLNISKQSVFTLLKKLIEKKLIIKIDKIINNVKLVDYKINLGVVKKLYGGSQETLLGGSQETLHHNTNIDNNKDNINKTYKKNLQEENDIFIDYTFCKNMYEELGFSNFDLERFYVFYKDKGLLKKDVENKMIQWDMRHKENTKNNKKDVWDINISDELMKKAEMARRQAMGGNNG